MSGDDEAYIHLLQRLSIAIQRGNCASVLGSTGVLTDRILLLTVHLSAYFYFVTYYYSAIDKC